VRVCYAILTYKRSKPTSKRPLVDVSSREVGVFILSKSLSLVVVVIIIIIVERERERQMRWGAILLLAETKYIKIKGNSGVIKDMQLMNGLKNRE
jgi:hypothetical protein